MENNLYSDYLRILEHISKIFSDDNVDLNEKQCDLPSKSDVKDSTSTQND